MAAVSPSSAPTKPRLSSSHDRRMRKLICMASVRSGWHDWLEFWCSTGVGARLLAFNRFGSCRGC
jgi:hypothetical protein